LEIKVLDIVDARCNHEVQCHLFLSGYTRRFESRCTVWAGC